MAHPTPKFNPSDSELRAAVNVIARCFMSLARDEQRAGTDQGWVDQHASTLGPRRHCSAARRRLAEGAGGAEHVGRRWLLTPAAVDEELGRPRRQRDAPTEDARDLARELGIKLAPAARLLAPVALKAEPSGGRPACAGGRGQRRRAAKARGL